MQQEVNSKQKIQFSHDQKEMIDVKTRRKQVMDQFEREKDKEQLKIVSL